MDLLVAIVIFCILAIVAVIISFIGALAEHLLIVTAVILIIWLLVAWNVSSNWYLKIGTFLGIFPLFILLDHYSYVIIESGAIHTIISETFNLIISVFIYIMALFGAAGHLSDKNNKDTSTGIIMITVSLLSFCLLLAAFGGLDNSRIFDIHSQTTVTKLKDADVIETKRDTVIYSLVDQSHIMECQKGDVFYNGEKLVDETKKPKQFRGYCIVISGDGIKGYIKAKDIKPLNISDVDNKNIALTRISSNRNTVNLYDLYSIPHKKKKDVKGFDIDKTVKDNLGETYSYGLSAIGYGSVESYNLNGNYAKISGTLVVDYENRNREDEDYLVIYGDDAVLYTSPCMKSGIEPIEFSVDVTAVNKLKIKMIGSRMLRLVDCKLEGNENETLYTQYEKEEVKIENNSIVRTDITFLSDLVDIRKSGRMDTYHDVKDNLGNEYDVILKGNTWSDNYIEYAINQKYAKMSATICLIENTDNQTLNINGFYLKILGDDNILYQMDGAGIEYEPQNIILDISNTNRLKIVVNDTNGIMMANPVLYEDANAEIYSPYRSVDYPENVSLYNMSPINRAYNRPGFKRDEIVYDAENVPYADGIRAKERDGGWESYYVNGEFVCFKGTLIAGLESTTEGSEQFLVYGDDNLLYSSPVITNESTPEEFCVDLTGIRILRVEISGNSIIRLVNGELLK